MWFIPSWNGDFRLDPFDDDECKLIVEKATPAEAQVLRAFLVKAAGKRWCKKSDAAKIKDGENAEILLRASMAEAAPKLVKACKPKAATLSAVRFKDGRFEVVEGTDETKIGDLAAKAQAADAPGATVSRPTPCCPSCVPGSVAPAREVLLSFLSPEEHAMWASDRAIVVRGERTGHRYAVAHRNSSRAVRWTRLCKDLDDGVVMHFHDTSVPPEEEVLAVKLILEHREAWLRNEATYFSGRGERFKNPFGNGGDGIWDSVLTEVIGDFARGALRGCE